MSYLGVDPNAEGGGLSALLSGAVNRYQYTATGGQTTFNAVYSPGYVDVYMNGIRLDALDFTATNGTTVVLAVAAYAGDLINIVGQEAYPATDTYRQADIDAALASKQNTLVSGTNIKTVGGNQLLGSGDVQVQAPLVSGTNIKTLNGASLLGSGDFVLASTPTVLQRNITGAGTLIVTDQGKLINTSGTFTLAVTSAATLGNGWYCWLRNASNGDVTVDPASTEQIDGATTYVLKPGFTVLLTCTGTAFTTLKVKERTYTNIASYTASGTFVVPADTYVIRGYAWGAGAPGTATEGGAGGGCAYGDIAVTPGETVTVTIASNIAKVITSATDRLTANPAVTTAGGTASKHASVTNGGAYSGGNSAAGSFGGGSASGSPLGVGGNSVGAPGGAAWGGFSGGPGGGAGVGEAGRTSSGGGSLRNPSNLFADPLLEPLTGAGGTGVNSTYMGAHGGPGGGGGIGTIGGDGGTGAGGGYGSTTGGAGGFGGGGGGYGTTTGGNGGLGGGGGGTGAGGAGGTGGTGGAACVLIYY